MNVKLKFNHSGHIAELKAKGDIGLKAVAEQALKDSNDRAPMDSGLLIASSVIHSELGKAKLAWNSPQARYLYHGVVMVDPKTGKAAFPIKDNLSGGTRLVSRKGIKKVLSDRAIVYSQSKNTKAGKLWAHRARAECGGVWDAIMQKAISQKR